MKKKKEIKKIDLKPYRMKIMLGLPMLKFMVCIAILGLVFTAVGKYIFHL